MFCAFLVIGNLRAPRQKIRFEEIQDLKIFEGSVPPMQYIIYIINPAFQLLIDATGKFIPFFFLHFIYDFWGWCWRRKLKAFWNESLLSFEPSDDPIVERNISSVLENKMIDSFKITEQCLTWSLLLLFFLGNYDFKKKWYLNWRGWLWWDMRKNMFTKMKL